MPWTSAVPGFVARKGAMRHRPRLRKPRILGLVPVEQHSRWLGKSPNSDRSPKDRTERRRTSGCSGGIVDAVPGVGGPTEQGGELVRRPLDFLPRSLQPLAETELWRRDVERRDEPALEGPDWSRRTNQAKLELPGSQRITPRARGKQPRGQSPNATP